MGEWQTGNVATKMHVFIFKKKHAAAATMFRDSVRYDLLFCSWVADLRKVSMKEVPDCTEYLKLSGEWEKEFQRNAEFRAGKQRAAMAAEDRERKRRHDFQTEYLSQMRDKQRQRHRA